MHDYHLYEYAVVRLVPRVERGEFINIGTILYCSDQKFLECMFYWNEPRILSTFPQADLELIKRYAKSFELICQADAKGGPIGQLTTAERFRWLTATRSTILQTSKVHPGFCKDAKTNLARLHEELVK